MDKSNASSNSCSEVPRDLERKREWIKYQLKIRGLSLADIAREHNISRQAVSTALCRPNPRWEHEIASALDMLPFELWPERYDNLGIPLREVV
ncbi:helix-turn-helix domain-containing protein [Aeromonas sp. QDB54]|uniref:helix-turn-helix domain-containing protein n=1 Tax=Aeromonas sp. QDB54 TaxID=2989826 RepID=UPI0022DF139C|nr:helix-turn-helix domain-containing protein [Aeromonas sp. QDB54]